MLLQENGRTLANEFHQQLLMEDEMAVTDIDVVKFSNERVRTVCDRLGRAYYYCDSTKDRWDSLGGGQPALDIMQSDIKTAANAILEAYFHCIIDERIWFVGNGASGINTLTPNTSESISDGSQADGRSPNTGQKVHACMERVVEFQNWLLNNSGGQFTSSLRNGLACLNTVLVCSSYGPNIINLTNANNFLTRCEELRVNYEATSNLNLGTILALAVSTNI